MSDYKSQQGSQEGSQQGNKILDYLLSPQSIRERCQKIYDLCLKVQTHFKIHEELLPKTADYVIGVIKKNYPDLKIPYHSRWGHFQVGDVDRLKVLQKELKDLSPLERAKAKWDLIAVSVLLDAGAGPEWRYQERETGRAWGRSEGLALASLHMFRVGLFSSQKDQPLRVDAEALLKLSYNQLAEGFEVSPDNPLVGLPGRHQLLQDLGKAMISHADIFKGHPPRFGDLIETWAHHGPANPLPAQEILKTLLRLLHSIWPGRHTLDGINLGDVWPYPPLAGDNKGQTTSGEDLIPFHKLSQWLTYSLVEPLEEMGLPVSRLDDLTGLAEYRNGGLFLDKHVLQLKDPQLMHEDHTPGSELIVEWRALTIVLLDRLAKLIRDKLGVSQEQWPLTKILEGGTWRAGREIAQKMRTGGAPPLHLRSDGTVF